MSATGVVRTVGVPSRDCIRVASVPAGHVYVRHLSDPDGDEAVVRLPDIPPADGRRVPGGWWPPAMLDADWIAAHHDTFDVFHVHFGFDAKTPEELRAVADALRARRRPARGHGPRPAQSASPVARAARRAARGADRARRRRAHAHAGRRAGDRGALGPGRRRCWRIRTSWTGTRWLGRARRTTASWSGCTRRACGPTWT